MKLGPYLYHLNTFNIPNNESVNVWVGGDATMLHFFFVKFCGTLKLTLDPPLLCVST